MPIARRELVTLLVLGALAEKPRCGYELKKMATSCMGSYYKVSDGTLYPLLRSLEADGLIDSSESLREGPHERFDYRITSAGLSRLVELAEATAYGDSAIEGVDFYARVFLRERMSAEAFERLVGRYVSQLEAEIDAIGCRMGASSIGTAATSVLELRKRQATIEREWALGLVGKDS